MSKVFSRDQAHMMFGPRFVSMIMKDKSTIEISEDQMVKLRAWQFIRQNAFVPYSFTYLYVFSSDGRYAKIGRSVAPRKRMSSLKGSGVGEIKFHGAVPVRDAGRSLTLERAVQKYFTGKGVHYRNEWFEMDGQEAFSEMLSFLQKNKPYDIMALSQVYDESEPVMRVYRIVKAEDDQSALAAAEQSRRDYFWMVNEMAKNYGVDEPFKGG